MASNSCEAVAERNDQNRISVDRFSNLTDEIAHKIMSRFSFKELTCLGCVSKRCKQLQLSAPFISLVMFGDENLGNMLDSFNSFMIQRGDNKILTFEFVCSCYIYTTHIAAHEKFQFSAWINSAVRCNVEKIYVHLFPTADVLFTIPSALFFLGSLKSLKLNIKCVIGGEVSFSPSLSNLESLDLSSVSVIDESFWRWISCSCKRLQNLTLVNIYGSKNIIIESPSLKKVEIRLNEGDCCNLSICANRLEDICICTCSNSSVNIFAPKVKFFSWGGIFPSRLNIGEMRCLNKGCISSNGEVTELATVVDVLCRMRCVKTLQLNDHVLKALSKDGFTFAPLNEVRCLEVPCDLTDALVPGLVHLLQRTPSLECLCLNTHLFASTANKFEDAHHGGFDMEFWKQQKLAFVDCLKNIAIILDGGSNAFEFARYILKDARNLERMDIFCDPNLYDEVVKLQDEMISSGTLIFHPVKEDQLFYKMSDFLRRANWCC